MPVMGCRCTRTPDKFFHARAVLPSQGTRYALQAELEMDARENMRMQIREVNAERGLTMCAEFPGRNGLPALLRKLDVAPKVSRPYHSTRVPNSNTPDVLKT